MKNLSTLYIILIFGGLIIGTLSAFFAQRNVHNQPLKKRRERLLIMLGIFFIFFFILSIINYVQGGTLWQDLFSSFGFPLMLLLLVGEFLYAFFRKDKQKKTADNK